LLNYNPEYKFKQGLEIVYNWYKEIYENWNGWPKGSV
jgi:dTDP-D-glucose 4,6-dehydratase